MFILRYSVFRFCQLDLASGDRAGTGNEAVTGKLSNQAASHPPILLNEYVPGWANYITVFL